MHCQRCGRRCSPSYCELNEAIDVMARAVIAGRYGNGDQRKELLYKDIQGRVNEIMGHRGYFL